MCLSRTGCRRERGTTDGLSAGRWGSGTTAWTILGTDQSLTSDDWEGLGITETRSHVYVLERLDVIYFIEPVNKEDQQSEEPE